MSKFKKDDRVVLVSPDEHDREFRELKAGATGTVLRVDAANWPHVYMDLPDGFGTPATYCFAPHQLEHVSTEPTQEEQGGAKLREPFIQFAMNLVMDSTDVEDAIGIARKLQEASE